MIDINILVTGGAGFVGSSLLPELLKNHYVRVLDNLTYGYYGIVPHIGKSNFDFIKGDIRNIDILRKSLKDIDMIIHLAAIVGYPLCKAQPEKAEEINYLGTKDIVENCKIPIIFASTGSCYGNLKKECTESSELNPNTLYSLTKIKAEKEIKKNDDFIIYRFSTGFGLSLRPRLDLLVNDFVYTAYKKRELIVYEKDYLRSFIHVKDMARSFLFALDNFDLLNHEVYNVGSADLNLTKEEVALKIKKYIDFYLKFAEFGSDPDIRNYSVSFDKINKIGFKTIYDLDYGIKEMIETVKFIDKNDQVVLFITGSGLTTPNDW